MITLESDSLIYLDKALIAKFGIPFAISVSLNPFKYSLTKSELKKIDNIYLKSNKLKQNSAHSFTVNCDLYLTKQDLDFDNQYILKFPIGLLLNLSTVALKESEAEIEEYINGLL